MDTYMIRDLPECDRPRERMENKGSKYLTNQELLAIILRTGTKEKSALQLAQIIMNQFESINNLRNVTIDELIEILRELKASEEWTEIKGIFNSLDSNVVFNELDNSFVVQLHSVAYSESSWKKSDRNKPIAISWRS